FPYTQSHKKIFLRHIMSAKLLKICHCERNEVERSNRKDPAITSLRYHFVRNDKHLSGHDISPSQSMNKP
ncbi:hypothetical protein, partial [Nostoc piscinale]|uniref:hypothetical protein n=1 Tax=Nostoc piscinale TaxID=224012 RepID=UPI0039A5B0D2